MLVALLVLTVLVAGSLAYEANDAARSHRVTAERALRDYASVAAWEFASNATKRLDGELDAALGPLTGGRANSPYDLLPPPALLASSAAQSLQCGEPAGDAGRYYFRLDLRDGGVTTAGTAPPAATLAWLRDTVTTLTRLVYRPEMRYALIDDPRQSPDAIIFYAVKYAQHGAPIAAYGFAACRAGFGSGVFHDVIRHHALLPSAVTGGVPNDSLLSIRVVDSRGRARFESPVTDSSPFMATVALDGFGGPLSVHATLRRTATERLLIGRPLHSRLPVLVGLLALTAALAVVATLQLRREHDLARLRADFTSSVSHELRTPLAQILLFGETLKLDRVRSEEDRRLAIDTIVHEARRLMHMVENVLHFSRANEGRMAIAPTATALGPLVESIVGACGPLAAEREMRILCDVPEPVTAHVDTGAFRQILLNLLDNALKYGAPGQTVRVAVSAAGDRARLTVDDEGRGIPLSDREQVWSPYVRLRRDQNVAHGGSGIGLAVVRELAELHGGAAWVDASPAGGARFVVELPLEAAAPLARGGGRWRATGAPNANGQRPAPREEAPAR
jgi:signal transduction histidine kinase